MAGEDSAPSAAPRDGAPPPAAGNIFDEQRRNRRDTWLLILGFVALLAFIGFGFDLFILGATGFNPAVGGSFLCLSPHRLKRLLQERCGEFLRLIRSGCNLFIC